MELLAPAGHWEAMVAAVQSGADSVYMGCGGFNARRGAKNFTPEEFAAAVAYCHLRGVKVYMTLNTLLTDRGAAPGGGVSPQRLPLGGGRASSSRLGPCCPGPEGDSGSCPSTAAPR